MQPCRESRAGRPHTAARLCLASNLVTYAQRDGMPFDFKCADKSRILHATRTNAPRNVCFEQALADFATVKHTQQRLEDTLLILPSDALRCCISDKRLIKGLLACERVPAVLCRVCGHHRLGRRTLQQPPPGERDGSLAAVCGRRRCHCRQCSRRAVVLASSVGWCEDNKQ
eukprot:scaffold306521_cov32-Tisochrysis_lutea.AAC.1